MKEKAIWVWPGSTRLLSGRQPVIYVGPALILAVFGFLLFSGLGLLITWWNIPFLPLPPSDKPALYHVYSFYVMWSGKLIALARGYAFYTYLGLIQKWTATGQANLFAFRWLFAIVSGIAGGFFMFQAGAKPFIAEIQVSGRGLLEGKEAYQDLKRRFDQQIAQDEIKLHQSFWDKTINKIVFFITFGIVKSFIPKKKGLNKLIMTGAKTFDANNLKYYRPDSKEDVLTMPDSQRRGHFVYIGKTGSGKGVTIKNFFMQLYQQIRRGENTKIFCIDTVKGEYSSMMKAKYQIRIAPDEDKSYAHDIARDLRLVQDAAKFASGLIPISEKDPFWGTAGQGALTGVMAFLIAEAGTDWGYNNICYFKDSSSEEMENIIMKYYPEMNQIMSMGEAPLSSVLGTMAGATVFMNDLARIWCGYDEKVAIHQMSASLLKRSYWIDFMLDKLYPYQVEIEEPNEKAKEGEPATITKVVDVPHNMSTSCLLRGLFAHLNATNKKWKWTDLKALLIKGFYEQSEIAKKYLVKEQIELIDRSYMSQYADHIKPYLQYAEIWDNCEAKPKVSLLEWVRNENPKKKVLVIKPSGRFKNQTEGLMRAMLFYMTGIINDQYLPEDKTKTLPQRNMYIIVDEFADLGDLKNFIMPALSLFRSKGVSVVLATQDFSQIKNIYGEDFLKFITANTANIIITGLNMGESADMVSNSMLGKKSIEKLHTSITSQETGTSSSRNYQKHDGESVMDSARINSDLGPKHGYVNYLYLPGGQPNAYILSTKIVDYPTNYVAVEPGWMKGEKTVPLLIDSEDVLSTLLELPETHMPVVREKKDPNSHTTQYLDLEDYVPDAASLMTQDDIEFAEEEQTLIMQNINSSERAPLYVLPTDEDDMQGDIMKDMAVDILGGGAVSTLKDAGELLMGTKRRTTTSKLKFYKAWKEKNGIDRDTQG